MKRFSVTTGLLVVGITCIFGGLVAAAELVSVGWLGRGVAQLSYWLPWRANVAGAVLFGSIAAVEVGLILSSIPVVVWPLNARRSPRLFCFFLGSIFLLGTWISFVIGLVFWQLLLGRY